MTKNCFSDHLNEKAKKVAGQFFSVAAHFAHLVIIELLECSVIGGAYAHWGRRIGTQEEEFVMSITCNTCTAKEKVVVMEMIIAQGHVGNKQLYAQPLYD